MGKLINEHVIRAISIGLSAVMAATPMTAFAAEENGNTVPATGNDGKTNVSTTAATQSQVTVAEVQQGVEAVQEMVSGTNGADASGSTTVEKQEQNVVDTVNQITEDKTLYDESVANAGKDYAQEVTDTEQKTTAGEALADVNNDLDKAQTEAGNIEQAVQKAEAAEEDLAKTAENLDGYINGDGTTEGAQASFDREVGKIQDAQTMAEAQEAYDNARKIAEEAQAKAEQAAGAAEAAEKSYEQAIQDMHAAEAAYEQALADAGADAEAALTALNAAKEKAAALEQTANAAKAEYEAAQSLAEQEKKVTQKNYGQLDAMFISIMDKYYIASQKENKDSEIFAGLENKESLEVTGYQIDSRFTKFSDDKRNYITVTYTFNDGTTKKVYYNYCLEEEGEYKNKGLIIFEKTFEDVLLEEAQEAHYEGGDQTYEKETVEKNATSTGQLDENTGKDWDGGYVLDENGNYHRKTADGTTENNEAYYDENDKLIEQEVFYDNNGKLKGSVEINDVTYELSLDENGNIVKTVRGKVTEISYTQASFTSGDKTYATEEEARKAAKENSTLQEGDILNATDIDVVKNTSYTSEATYVSKFEVTIDLTGMQKTKGNLALDNSASDAKSDMVKETKKNLQKVLGDAYEIIATNSKDVSVKKTKDEDWFGEDTYTATGSVTFTFVAKESTLSVKYSTVDQLKDWIKPGAPLKDAAVAKAKAEIEQKNGFYDDFDWFNWNFKTSDVTYYGDSVSTTATDKYATQEEAAQAAKAKAQSEVNDVTKNAELAKVTEKITGRFGKTAAVSASIRTDKNGNELIRTKEDTVTDYSYEANYLKSSKTVKEKELLSTTLWNAEQLTFVDAKEAQWEKNRPTNANYAKGNILLDQYKDQAYRDFVDNGAARYTAYEKLRKEAEAAKAAEQKAAEEVEKLKAQIEALQNTAKQDKTNRTIELAALQGQYEAAKKKYEDAKEKIDDLEEKLKDAEKELEKKQQNSAEEEVPGGGNTQPGGNGGDTQPGGNGGDTQPGGTGDNGGTTPTTFTITEQATPLAATPGATGAAAAVNLAAGGAGANAAVAGVGATANAEGLTTIQEEVTPLAATPDEQKETVTIADEETPLADSMEEQTKKMSWWWLLIVAVLGATGYEMYKKHEEKKKLAEQETAE